MNTRFVLTLALLVSSVRAELRLPAVIGDNMVLQQKQVNRLWGWDAPGTTVTVTFAAQRKRATADAKGRWTVALDPAPASAQPATIRFEGTTTREVSNVLVGEVWLCSGQSNMEFSVAQAHDGDLEVAAAKFPAIRLITVAQVGTQELQDDFAGRWEECSPQTVGSFTAVGYYFGRVLHEILGVPIGLIDNSWGGSKCEAWVQRDLLEQDARFQAMLARWRQIEATYDFNKAQAEYETLLAKWQSAAAQAEGAGRPSTPRPKPPRNPLTGQARPGNLFAGVLHPIIGYGIKGVLWYQGEGNAERGYEYGYLFPLMIQNWRDAWQQENLPFYWAQIADVRPERPEPGESDLAELRESQTKTMAKLRHTGQAVIIDLGEGNDVHARNKQDVAKRLARWPLAKDYGMRLAHRSPEFKAMRVQEEKAVLTFDCFGSSLRTRDVNEARGFALCGSDRKWVWANATIDGAERVTVSSPKVAHPIAVRYAWADNPVCNVYSREGLPLTPFRTDDFPMITDPKTQNR